MNNKDERKILSYAISKEKSMCLKGVAICAMLWHHLFGCASPDAMFCRDYITMSLGFLGKICVSLFLLVSGYGLAKQYSTQNIIQAGEFGATFGKTIKFLLKRFIKFYANYWSVFVIFVPIGILCFNRSFSDVYGNSVAVGKYVIMDIFGLLWGNSYNVTWWFNSLILTLYVLFPILFVVSKRFPVITFIVSLLLVIYGDAVHIAYRGINRWFFPFCVGIIWATHTGQITNWMNKINRKTLYVILLFLTFVFSFFRLYGETPFSYKSIMDGCIAITISIFVATIENKYLVKIFSMLGRHAGNMYMIHTFIILWFSSIVYCPYFSPLIFLTLLVFCVGISMILEFLKEQCRVTQVVKYISESISK